MKKVVQGFFAAVAVLALALAVFAGTTNMPTNVVIQDSAGSPPTCSLATADGDLCVEGDVEVVTNLEVDGTTTLTGATTQTGALTVTADVTINGGAGAITLSGSGDSSAVLADNDATAFVMGAAGELDIFQVDTTNSNGGVIINGDFQVLNSGATAGWTAATGVNTACTTTCAGTGACLFGYDSGGGNLVACADATADSCICGGPAS